MTTFKDLGKKEIWIKWLLVAIAVLLFKALAFSFLTSKLPGMIPALVIEAVSLFGIIAIVDFLSGKLLEV